MRLNIHDTIVIITGGGNHSTWDSGPPNNALKTKNAKNPLETSGAYPLSGTWD